MGSRRTLVIPGSTWALDRRTTNRFLLLTPDHERHRIQNAFWYGLGFYAERHGIVVHAAVLMSNHFHLLITDPQGTRPHFKRDFHRTFAHCVKSIRRWPEEVFSKAPTGEHEPLTVDALVEAHAYLITNPVDAGLVRYHSEWPGVITRPQDLGTRVIRVPRPDVYMREDGQWPDFVELRLEMHPVLERELGAEQARRRVAARVAERERAAHRRMKAEGRTFLGRRRVLRTRYTQRANSDEPFGSRNPTFSAAGDRAAAREAKRRWVQFNRDYNRALARWTSGDRRRAVFPYGTWWMVVHHGARVRPPP